MKRATVAAAILALASTASFAQSSVYIVGGIGIARVDSDITGYSTASANLAFTQSADTRGTAFGLLLGRELNNQWSIEGGYLNIRGLSANAAIVANNALIQGNRYNGSINARQDISGYALTLAPRYTHRFGGAEVFVKAGIAHVKVENEVTVTGSGTVNGSPAAGSVRQRFRDSSTVPMVGLGAQFFATRNLGIRGDYTYIAKVGDSATTGESAVSLLMISGVYRF